MMLLLLLLTLKQFVEQFIKKFCSVFVFQKDHLSSSSVRLKVSAFFPLEKFYPIPIFVWVLNSNFVWVLNASRVCVTILKGAMILSNKFSIISLCDYSN
jgi:hypothetical protein